jgi:integrase/recombinase XerD
MKSKDAKNARKRGQRRTNIDIPRRLLDHLTPAALETWQDDDGTVHKTKNDVLSPETLFNRYYSARQAAGVQFEQLVYPFCRH